MPILTNYTLHYVSLQVGALLRDAPTSRTPVDSGVTRRITSLTITHGTLYTCCAIMQGSVDHLGMNIKKGTLAMVL